MSKTMQMKVTIHPYYQKGFGKTYPKIARALGKLDETMADAPPSLFHLVGQLDKLLYRLEGNEPVRNVFLQYRRQLFDLYEKAEDHIADRRLAEADQVLYQIEDVFEEIERELGKV